MNTLILKEKVRDILEKQGFKVMSDGTFILKKQDREGRRRAQTLAKIERLMNNESFIKETIKSINPFLIDGKNLKIEKIDPQIIEVKTGTEEEKLFKWWNLVWWSLPYERSYGRQMRFIIWDKYHNVPIGLIGLQSPILKWKVRDEYLGISTELRDYWINQSMNAQRIGALPPYNYILGGKLVALLMTTDVVRKKFQEKYENQRTILKNRKLPARLLFITTTGAYGKSSVYNRLKFKGEEVVKFIGYTHGSGTFHIPNVLYEDLVKYLKKKGYNIRRGFGSGPSRKLRLIDQALRSLGFMNGATHGIKRAVYLFPLVKNLKEVIQKNSRPRWIHRSASEVTDFWKNRWAIPRAKRDNQYLKFVAEKFIQKVLRDLRKYKHKCQII